MASSNVEHADFDSATKIKLGFVEEADSRLLTSTFFPSKVGGRPAWLSFDPLLEPDSLQCDICVQPMVFLMQVYGPLKEYETFHRSIFIFVCPAETCVKENNNKNFKVFRSQLPHKNTFYSEDPPNEDDLDSESSFQGPSASDFHNLCHVCGVKSKKKCAKCKEVYYCSKEHQIIDWKCRHKIICALGEKQTSDSRGDIGMGLTPTLLFKEYELVTEEEDLNSDSTEKKTDDERMEEYKVMLEALKMKGADMSQQYKDDDLNKAATGETDDDKHFLHFKKRIDVEPTQVLRYCRGGQPLWVSAFHKPELENIPDCDCGSKRIFEFQVMPQLLNYIETGKLDWGTLCIYTCSQSCNIGTSYHQEFLWKQDFHGREG